MKAGLGVDDHDDDVGRIGGGLGLAASRIGELEAMRHVGAGVDAGRIDQAESSSAPVGECVEAIPRDPGAVLYDRQPAADQAVKEGALADVRTSDDCNCGWV